jgi:hypothetical protein
LGHHFLQMTSLTGIVHRHWSRAFTVAIPVAYALALVVFARRVGTADYDQFLVFHELQYWNAALFGLAKQWTPVMCSGLSLAAEPQVPFASLPMLLGYALGPLPGIVVGNIVYFALGWIGAYLYSGLWFVERARRALAASLFIGNGFFICRLVHGHLDFIPFLALPLALWIIHRATEPPQEPAASRSVLCVLWLGCLFTLVIDGSPVAIIHWLFWIGVYSVVLSCVRRSSTPVLAFIAACAVTCFVDAGYLWPMIRAQSDFPRLTEDTFTGPWSLPWFMLIPMRGKVLPANGTGIELSVFIGPVLFYLIWRYRRALLQELPRELLLPLAVVSVISIWLGMGSLRVAHLPVWLSPFDWLRSLPGFRSIGVTGRFWGFLALPLSLLAASALWRYANSEPWTRRSAVLVASAFLIQMGFQGESLVAAWWPSHVQPDFAVDGMFNGKLERITMLQNPGTAADPHMQGEVIAPLRAVANCYDMDNFTRAPVHSGTNLIKTVQERDTTPVEAGFMTWNRIRILKTSTTPSGFRDIGLRDPVLHIVLNQAYHTGWHSTSCALERSAEDNLVASCPAKDLDIGPVDLFFSDPVSELGARVSLTAAPVLGASIGLLTLGLAPRRRLVGAPSPAR